ncbi:hypothetical protein FA95DRAFT_1608987 [Auriscalpium vulgare]|uniref:Uncharacterized protein n=1 Tax=Auriscalpium vulgare TaxID=40419 RepID=A0ACB8RJ05_9AGAM|nr:hypothetical protein FA95DRAFT_1608987 [Auriscalpium vulgare]
MAPYTPTDDELSSAIQDAFRDHVVPSFGCVHAYIKDNWPQWGLSRKRLNVLLAMRRAADRNYTIPPLPFNALLILPDSPILGRDRSLVSLDAIRMRIRPLNIELDDDGFPTADSLRQAVGQGRVIPQRKVYHKDPGHTLWCYSIYGQDMHTVVDSDIPFNSLAHRFVRDREGFQGPALVVKRGPPSLKNEWLNSDYMTVDALARTLWWYHQTGTRVEYVATQRSQQRRLERQQRDAFTYLA